METEHFINKSEAQEILIPHHYDLTRCIEVAWEDWSEFSEKRPPVFARTRANTLYQFITDEARQRFGTNPEVQIRERNGQILLVFDNRLVVRFKKLSTTLSTSNIQTTFSSAFNAQMEIPELPACGRVTVGYRLQELNTELRDIRVVYSNENEVLWSYELEPSAVYEFPQPTQSTKLQLVQPLADESEGQEVIEPAGD